MHLSNIFVNCPDLLALVCDVELCVCYFPIGILGQVWYLIVSIPDLCRLSYFELASHGYCSTHCIEAVDVLDKKKTELQELPLPRAVFLEGVKLAQYQ